MTSDDLVRNTLSAINLFQSVLITYGWHDYQRNLELVFGNRNNFMYNKNLVRPNSPNLP